MSDLELKNITQGSSIDPEVWVSSSTSNYKHFLGLQTKTSGTLDTLLHPHQLSHLPALQNLRNLIAHQRLQLPELGQAFELLVLSAENVGLPNIIAGNEFSVWLSQRVLGQAGQLCIAMPFSEDISEANTVPILEPPSRLDIEDAAPDIYQLIKNLCEAAKEETFESGVESNFSRELFSLISEYGNIAIEVLANLITTNNIDEEVASEVLLSLGRVDHLASYSFRLWLLERSLSLPSLMVRDSAALGLAYLDDPHSIPYLKAAIEREECKEVLRVMKKVLIQLEKTLLASLPSKNKKD